MAYRLSNTAPVLNTLRELLVSRGSIHKDPAYPGFYVVCAKHPGVEIFVDVYNEANILASFREAFDSCAGCLNDAQYKQDWEKTRFPEDAEL